MRLVRAAGLDTAKPKEPSTPREFFDSRGSELLGTPTANANTAAFADERSGAREAEPATGPGNDRNLVGELQIHLLRRAAGQIVEAPVERMICHLEFVLLQEFFLEGKQHRHHERHQRALDW